MARTSKPPAAPIATPGSSTGPAGPTSGEGSARRSRLVAIRASA
jgi:hypothetical protein